MRVATLSIGDELTHGSILDRNSAWLASAFDARGCEVLEQRTVSDDRAAIERAFTELSLRAELIVSTGGLGPTADDLTREGLADALGEELLLDAEALGAIEARFAARGRSMSESNRRQAFRPVSGVVLANSNGTAPGIEARLGDSRVVLLPGPPHEMQSMFQEWIDPTLDQVDTTDCRALVKCYGIGESQACELLGSITDRDAEPQVGTRVSDSVLSAFVKGNGAPEVAGEIERCWRPYAFGMGSDTLESVLGELLRAGEKTLATAESCTGGLLGGRITAVAGSSAWYGGGVVTYTNELKDQLLGVGADLIERVGAVSEQVAVVMAMEAARRFGTSCALSTTGIAGPDGGTEDKPVGTVWIGVCDASGERPNAWAKCFHFPGERERVRDRTVKSALQMLRLHLLSEKAALLWEVNR